MSIQLIIHVNKKQQEKISQKKEKHSNHAFLYFLKFFFFSGLRKVDNLVIIKSLSEKKSFIFTKSFGLSYFFFVVYFYFPRLSVYFTLFFIKKKTHHNFGKSTPLQWKIIFFFIFVMPFPSFSKLFLKLKYFLFCFSLSGNHVACLCIL